MVLEQCGNNPVSLFPVQAAGNYIDRLGRIPGEDSRSILSSHKGCHLAMGVSIPLVGDLRLAIYSPADIGSVATVVAQDSF